MNILKIDVAKDILKSQFGFAINAEAADLFVEKKIAEVSCNTLFLVDLKEIVFDHYFARTFGNLFFKASDKSSMMDVIFFLKNYQVEDFLLGLLDSQNIPFSIEKDGNIIDFFITQKHSIKLITNENEISYISKKSIESVKLLEFINKKLETDFDEIYRQKILDSGEDIYQIINELINLRCIYSDSTKKYYSIYKYL
jgi:hypothetical protein